METEAIAPQGPTQLVQRELSECDWGVWPGCLAGPYMWCGDPGEDFLPSAAKPCSRVQSHDGPVEGATEFSTPVVHATCILSSKHRRLPANHVGFASTRSPGHHMTINSMWASLLEKSDFRVQVQV